MLFNGTFSDGVAIHLKSKTGSFHFTACRPVWDQFSSEVFSTIMVEKAPVFTRHGEAPFVENEAAAIPVRLVNGQPKTTVALAAITAT